MDDLISRYAAIDALTDTNLKRNVDSVYDGDMNRTRRAAQRVIAQLPAVDAAQVVHGRWKAYSVPHWTKRYDDNGDPEYKYHDEYVCSICRRRTIIKENYCPKCGAKMDGDRKIHAMHKRYGIDWENTCQGCCHLISGEWHDRRYHKCELYGMSHSDATDWRLSWMACGMFNVSVDTDKMNPVYKTLSNKREPEPQLEGQMDISAFLGGRDG